MTMTFTLEGDDKLARKLGDRRTRLGPQVRIAADPIEAMVGQLGILGVKHAQDEAPEDTGKLKRGLRFTFRGNRGIIESTAKHTPYVIRGRQPGTFPPVSAILGWVGRRGMPASAAFPVARKIAEQGIAPNDFMSRAFVRMRGDLAPTKRQFLRRVERNWSR